MDEGAGDGGVREDYRFHADGVEFFAVGEDDDVVGAAVELPEEWVLRVLDEEVFRAPFADLRVRVEDGADPGEVGVLGEDLLEGVGAVVGGLHVDFVDGVPFEVGPVFAEGDQGGDGAGLCRADDGEEGDYFGQGVAGEGGERAAGEHGEGEVGALREAGGDADELLEDGGRTEHAADVGDGGQHGRADLAGGGGLGGREGDGGVVEDGEDDQAEHAGNVEGREGADEARVCGGGEVVAGVVAVGAAGDERDFAVVVEDAEGAVGEHDGFRVAGAAARVADEDWVADGGDEGFGVGVMLGGGWRGDHLSKRRHEQEVEVWLGEFPVRDFGRHVGGVEDLD